MKSNEAPAPREATQEKARELAGTLFGILNLMVALAAPRVLVRLKEHELAQMTQERVLALVDRHLAFIDSPEAGLQASDPFVAAAELARRMRTLLESWEFSFVAPTAIVQAARDYLTAYGLPEPAEGWDQWEGPNEEDDEDAHRARPPETPGILCSEPMTLAEWLALDKPGELFDGMLIEEETSTPLHDAAVTWLLASSRACAEPQGARVFGPKHKLGMSSELGRKPDLCVYAPNQPPNGPPALVIEVLSPTSLDKRRVYIQKMGEYARFGIRRLLIVAPTERHIELYELGADGRYAFVMGSTEGTVAPEHLDGIAVDLDALWSELDQLAGTESSRG